MADDTQGSGLGVFGGVTLFVLGGATIILANGINPWKLIVDICTPTPANMPPATVYPAPTQEVVPPSAAPTPVPGLLPSAVPTAIPTITITRPATTPEIPEQIPQIEKVPASVKPTQPKPSPGTTNPQQRKSTPPLIPNQQRVDSILKKYTVPLPTTVARPSAVPSTKPSPRTEPPAQTFTPQPLSTALPTLQSAPSLQPPEANTSNNGVLAVPTVPPASTYEGADSTSTFTPPTGMPGINDGGR